MPPTALRHFFHFAGVGMMYREQCEVYFLKLGINKYRTAKPSAVKLAVGICAHYT